MILFGRNVAPYEFALGKPLPRSVQTASSPHNLPKAPPFNEVAQLVGCPYYRGGHRDRNAG